MHRLTIPYHLSASASAEGDVTLWTVQGAKKFRIDEIIVRFPSGTAGQLKIYLKYGAGRRWPTGRELVGDSATLKFKADLEYEGGDDIVLHYKNESTTDTLECYIYLCGTLID